MVWRNNGAWLTAIAKKKQAKENNRKIFQNLKVLLPKKNETSKMIARCLENGSL